MSTSTKVVGFVAGLAAVFALTLGVGNAVGDVTEDPVEHSMGPDDDHDPSADPGHGAAAVPASDEQLPGGLMVSQSGYTLALADQNAPAGDDVSLAFRILAPDGEPVTAYDVEHEKQLHLIAVRRDFTGFQHVHPVLAADGSWTTELDLTSGQWRVFADFTPTGAEALTLGTDLAVSGPYDPAPQRPETRTARVGDYTVTLDGDLRPGADSQLTLSVQRDGRPVTDLDPYLGAYGHLVALRAGDLAYLHVHPDGSPGDGTTQPGPDVVFYAAVPSAGTYNLFLDFKHEGQVRTASFSLSTSGAPATGPEPDPHDDHTDH